eukprot:2929005-Prymnesium_polylepis.1
MVAFQEERGVDANGVREGTHDVASLTTDIRALYMYCWVVVGWVLWKRWMDENTSGFKLHGTSFVSGALQAEGRVACMVSDTSGGRA